MFYSNKDLRKLILPLLVEQLLIMLVGMVDTVMISVCGEAAVSGVSLVDTVNILMINVFGALANGGAVVAGHFLGQKNKEDAGKAAWQLMLFSFLSSIGVMILYLCIHTWVLGTVFGSIEADVYSNAKSYLLITAVSIPPLAVYNGAAALFRAEGNSKVTMLISILMNSLNIIGNYILIYVIPMGTAGAAISTTFSRIAAGIVGFVLIYYNKKDISLKGKLTWRLNGAYVKKILYIGLPNSLESSMFQLGKIVLMSLISTLGTSAITANAVAGSITNINIIPGMAINMALLSVASYCVGAGDREQVKYYTKKIIKLAYLSLGIVSVIIFALVRYVLLIYHLTPETHELTTEIIRYHAIMTVLIWVPSFSLPNTLRAAGDVMYPMVTSIISMWICRIGFAYLFTYLGLGVMGVWIAMTLDWALRAVLYIVRYKKGKWQKFFLTSS